MRRLVAACLIALPTVSVASTDPPTGSERARHAYQVAEAHARSCDDVEATRWFREVIRTAPRTPLAAFAAVRIAEIAAPVVTAESREPPIAR